MTDLLTLARENGFTQCAPLAMDALVPLPQVRDMCAADRCGRWGKSWSCPPACGTLEQARQQMRRYTSGVLVQSTGQLEDPFDYEGISALTALHKTRFENFARQARLLFPGCLPLTAGTCTICARCTYPGRPCRFPRKRLSSMEAYGLLVSDVCIRSGLQYNYGPNTLTYTSCILYEARHSEE